IKCDEPGGPELPSFGVPNKLFHAESVTLNSRGQAQRRPRNANQNKFDPARVAPNSRDTAQRIRFHTPREIESAPLGMSASDGVLFGSRGNASILASRVGQLKRLRNHPANGNL